MSNDFIQAADNDEVDGSGTSFVQSATDFFTYGVTSSIVSGGVGIWNSVKAIGNTMGADLAMTNEADVVQNLSGEDAKNYYLEHKVGADLGGLVLSAVGTGLAALKAFRGIQAMGNVAGTGRFGFTNALGVSNPDIVLASKQAHNLRTAVQADVTEFTWRNKEFAYATGWAARQNLQEAVVMEGAYLVLNNQNTMLNPDQLGAWDSTKNLASESLGFIALGAGIGTAIDTIRLYGAAKGAFRAIEGGNNANLRVVTADALTTYAPAGDKLYDASRLQRELDTNPKYAIDESNAAELATRNKAQYQVEQFKNESLLALNKADEAGTELAKQVLAKQSDVDQLAVLGNLQSMERPTLEHYTEQLNSYGLRSGVEGKSLEQAASFDESIKVLTDLNRQSLQGSNQLWRTLGANLTSTKGSNLLKELVQYGTETGDTVLVSLLRDAQAAAMASKGLPAAEKALQKAALAGKQAIGFKVAGTRIPPEYADDLAEAIYGLAAKLQHTATGAEAAQRLPALAKMLDKRGAYTKSWNAVTGWYNIRTGRSLTATIPKAQDLGRVQEFGDHIVLQGTGLRYTYRVDATDPFKVLEAGKRANADLEAVDPTLEVSAHWAAAALRKLSSFMLGSEYRAHATDLPAIERIVTGMKDDEVLRLSGVGGVGGTEKIPLTKAEGVAFLLERKEAARAAYQMAGYNEAKIANLLNTGENFALGQAHHDFMLMDKMDYSKAENVLLRYKKYDTKRVDLAARDFSGVMARTELQKQAELQAFGKVIGVDASLFPDEALDLLSTLSATELKAGVVNSATSEFGKFREWAAYVGSLTHGMKDASRQKIEHAFYGHLQALSKEDNFAGRAQLALFNNMARKDSYRVFRLDEVSGTSHMAIKDVDFGDFMKEQMQLGRTEEQALEFLTSKGVAEGMIRSKGALGLRKDVGELVDTHMSLNAKYITNDFALSSAMGRSMVRRPEIYYAPPVDLRVTPHFRFVIPKGGQPELGRFMIYGANQAELEAKAAYVEQQYGATHRVVDQEQVSLIKKLRGEYDAGKVFTDYEFDAGMQKLGRASDIQPSLDIHAAESLDLLRNWHHNKSENQIMQAVELKYAATMQALKKADAAFDSSNITALGERKAVLGIYEDTRRTMLDSKTWEGGGADMYRRLNDTVSVTGGKAIHATAEAIRSARGAKGFTQADLDALTKELDAHGFVNPYDNLTTLLSRSAVISDGRELNSLMRLANTLVASTTLRLDFMNSALQLMSTPLLLHGAIKEAKLSLKGTEAYKRLLDMTTAVNPANGMREPTAAKLMTEAIGKWFTKEGSEFAEELRKRFMLTDYNRQYLEAHDYSSLNGRHTLNTVQQKVDQLATFGSKFTLHQKSEDMSRFMVAWSMKKIAETRGLGEDETYALIRNAIDKVHGVYRSHQRVQLFNGVIGQSVGLFQTYMFNVAQYMTRHISEGAGKEAAMAAFMQSTVFGIRSLPAFNTLNGLVAGTNSGQLDIYSLAGSEADPTGVGSYMLYGLGSHALMTPVDFFSRGDMVLRNNLVIPTRIQDIPAVSIISKAVANMVRTGEMVAGAGTTGEVGAALAYGLAHNALNRPLQGLGTIMLGNVTTNSGTPVFINSNYTGYDPDAAFNYAAMGARLLGGKPKTEAILLDSYYRRTAYQQEQSKVLADLGSRVRVQMMGEGGVTDEAYSNFFTEYSSAGGTPENFHQFFSRNMGQASEASIVQFRTKMQGDNPTSRAYNRLLQERADTPAWQYDSEQEALSPEAPVDTAPEL